ncbi:MAG: cobalt-precorrin-5B (C(1))-methyltransferase CbiD [Deferribacteraceae bacterium]|jgi:cobalt-precorrin-5B (C1)-methyltransferase|nr:cobalt-precorrin-5B (C(1))-methyltransferase CbiD [Deferribacteraceae bacterium]
MSKIFNSISKLQSKRTGFTTGSAATAATIAAYLELTGKNVPNIINICLPDGSTLNIPLGKYNGVTGVFKDAGDDPDVTNGIFIYALVEITDDDKIVIDGGNGVGRVTKRGLPSPIGNAAINPVPVRMIEDNLRPLLPERAGAKVMIYVPCGEKTAEKTFNSRLGITRGISILGTSGIVWPMSSGAVIAAVRCEIDVLAAENTPFIWMVPGKIGETALRRALPETAVVQFSNYAGEAFSYVKEKGYTAVGVAGHPGKLAKLAMGAKNTHSSCFTQANSYVRSLFGIKDEIIGIEEICTQEWRKYLDILACKISLAVGKEYGFRLVKVRLFSMAGLEVGKYE